MVPLLTAWATPTGRLGKQPQSRLWVEGTSTLRSYECGAGSFDLEVMANGTDPVAAVLRGEKAVTAVEVKVPAARLDCANGTMNEHMVKALKADRHPQIAFRLNSYELTGAGAATQVKLTGSLELGGTQKPVTINARAEPAGAGVLRVRGAHEIQMSEFGIRAPTLMMGTLRVGDRATVNFDLLLKG